MNPPMTTEEIALAMQHSKPNGKFLGIPFKVVDKEFLADGVVAIFGYEDRPQDAVLLVERPS